VYVSRLRTILDLGTNWTHATGMVIFSPTSSPIYDL
jgi:hypothetical protein